MVTKTCPKSIIKESAVQLSLFRWCYGQPETLSTHTHTHTHARTHTHTHRERHTLTHAHTHTHTHTHTFFHSKQKKAGNVDIV